MKPRRSMLFIPGANAAMLSTSFVYGADAVMFDLEDAVSLREKDTARLLVYQALQHPLYQDIETVVRINPLSTPFGLLDLEAELTQQVGEKYTLCIGSGQLRQLDVIVLNIRAGILFDSQDLTAQRFIAFNKCVLQSSRIGISVVEHNAGSLISGLPDILGSHLPLERINKAGPENIVAYLSNRSVSRKGSNDGAFGILSNRTSSQCAFGHIRADYSNNLFFLN